MVFNLLSPAEVEATCSSQPVARAEEKKKKPLGFQALSTAVREGQESVHLNTPSSSDTMPILYALTRVDLG